MPRSFWHFLIRKLHIRSYQEKLRDWPDEASATGVMAFSHDQGAKSSKLEQLGR